MGLLIAIYVSYDERTADSIFCYETVLGELQCSLDYFNGAKAISIGDFYAFISMNSEACVHFNGSFSSSLRINQGVRQGGVLCACLFTYYYIDNILKCVFIENIGCHLGVKKFDVLAYANDIVMIVSIYLSAAGLRTLLNVFTDSVVALKLVLAKRT